MPGTPLLEKNESTRCSSSDNDARVNKKSCKKLSKSKRIRKITALEEHTAVLGLLSLKKKPFKRSLNFKKNEEKYNKQAERSL